MSLPAALFVALALTASGTPSTRPPRLTVFITVDSLGTDVLLRNRGHFKAGLKTLLDDGAFFPNARYEQAETVTAAGHATLATGAYPWRTGIVGNKVLNRATGKLESIYTDATHPVLEAPLAAGDVSPEHLMAETLSDRVRLTTQGRGKAVAVASKGRAAIGQAGRLGQAWWFNEQVGKFVTGTFYAKEFPAWVKAFNDKQLPDASFGKDWALSLPAKEYVGDDDRPFELDAFGLGKSFPHPIKGGLTAPGPQSRMALESTPLMGDLLVQFARAAIDGEQLGRDDVPDLLFVSFSQIDRVYHTYGPYSFEMQDALARLDRSVGDLISAVEKAAGGKQNVLVVLSADHGGAAIPEEWAQAGMPGRRVDVKNLTLSLNQELQKKFGANLVQGVEQIDVYLDQKAMADRKLDGATVRRYAAQWLMAQPFVQLAVAKDDLDAPGERLGYAGALRRSYFPDRSGDVLFLMKPFSVQTDEYDATSHGTPYAYDTQVPVIFYGRGVKGGLRAEEIHPVDVAPTVSTALQMGQPAECEGLPRNVFVEKNGRSKD